MGKAPGGRYGSHRGAYEKNKQIIYKTQDVCGICGLPVDKTLKYPNPMSKSVDHIIPIDRGGHKSDIQNLQLAHLSCNRQKSANLVQSTAPKGNYIGTDTVIDNRILPKTIDWINYKSK